MYAMKTSFVGAQVANARTNGIRVYAREAAFFPGCTAPAHLDGTYAGENRFPRDIGDLFYASRAPWVGVGPDGRLRRWSIELRCPVRRPPESRTPPRSPGERRLSSRFRMFPRRAAREGLPVGCFAT